MKETHIILQDLTTRGVGRLIDEMMRSILFCSRSQFVISRQDMFSQAGAINTVHREFEE